MDNLEELDSLYKNDKFIECQKMANKILEEFPKSPEALLYRARCKHRLKSFEEALEDYQKAFKADRDLMWSRSKKGIVRDFLKDCEEKKPFYKSVFLENRKWTNKYPRLFPPLFIFFVTFMLIVLPGLYAKLLYIKEDYWIFIISVDLVTTLAFVTIGSYMLFAMRFIEAYAIRVVCFENYDLFPSYEKFQEYITFTRRNFYPKTKRTFTYPIIGAVLILGLIHAMYAILGKDLLNGLLNSLYQYVGSEYSSNDSIIVDGYLKTLLSFVTRLWFEVGFVVVLVCMLGLVFYVIQMFHVIGAMRKYDPIVDFRYPDGAMGFKPVSNFLFRIEGLGVILVILIQFFFIILSRLHFYEYSSMALLPTLGDWDILALSALFAIVPILAAIWVFIKAQRGLELMISESKWEKLSKYSTFIQNYENNVLMGSKTHTDIQFIIDSYNQVKTAPEGLVNYTTLIKAILISLPSLLPPLSPGILSFILSFLPEII